MLSRSFIQFIKVKCTMSVSAGRLGKKKILLKWQRRGNCGLCRKRKQTAVFAVSTSSMLTFILPGDSSQFMIAEQIEELGQEGEKVKRQDGGKKFYL